MKSSLLILFLFIGYLSFSQKVTVPIDIENHINQLLMTMGEEADNQSYYELLMQFFNSKININNCSYSELSVLQILSDSQVEDIISHRDYNGDFDNKYELLAVQSLTTENIKTLLPFLSFNKPIRIGNMLKNTFGLTNNYVLASSTRNLELADGFVSNNYLGDSYQYNVRIKFVNPGYSSIGLTLQKDPGELIFRTDSVNHGPDFYSFHYYVQNQGRVKQFALGDYKLQFGQGLLLGAGFLVGKNANSITSIQTTLKIQPYTSLTEFRFFRGAGATISLSTEWEVSMFYSNKRRDATVVGINDQQGISSLRTNGLHRTSSELNAQNSVIEQVAGTAITYENKSIEIGLLGLYNQFSIPFSPSSSLANTYKFRGQENYNISAFGRYHYQNITLYGEAAHTIQHGSAINIGVITSLSKNIDFSFQYRYLTPDFYSFYGLSFSESSNLSNERGAYWGTSIKLSPSLSFMGYFDMYKFPWLTSTIPQPTTGTDGLVRINYKLKKSALFYSQVQSEQKNKNVAGTVVKETKNHRLIKYVLNLDYNLENKVSFRSRIQWSKSYFEENEVGFLIYQDINLQLKRITISSRYAIFDTDGFLSRQYMFEKGILYSFNTPQFSGKGIRYYFVTKYAPIKGLVFRAKWSQTIYYDRTAIGTGLSLIEGNKKSQISFQIKYDF